MRTIDSLDNLDIKVFIVSIPLISAFNYYLTYSNIQFNSFLLFTYLIDTFTGYVAWLGIRWMIFKLNRIYPFSKNLTTRIVIQIILTTIIGLSIIILLTELASWIIKGRPALVNFYTIDLFIIFIWLLVINAFYIVLYFYKQWRKGQKQHENLIRAKIDFILVKIGRKEIKVRFKDIRMILVDKGLTEILTEKRTLRCLLTLDSLENQLPKYDFFRVNRQIIIARNIFKEYIKIENGKLKVILSIAQDINTTIISRERAPKFKRWLKLE